MTITTTSGGTYSEYSDGFAEFPPLDQRLATAMDKSLDNVMPIVGEARAQSVAEVIMRLETAEKASEVLDVLHA